MMYFGAEDGMLHAVCAEVKPTAGCDVLGRELWAYIPRTVLPDLRQSTARVDGSPHVIDAYGDFDNNGTNAWHTILIFHTGTGRMTNNNVVPAVYAIDITTPNSPKVLWEYSVTNVGTRQAVDMGIGLNITAGKISSNQTVAFVQTNQGGTGGAARMQVPGVALAAKTGTAQVRRITMAERRGGVLSNASLPFRMRDHAHFICFAPADNPRYAAAIVLEHGGHTVRNLDTPLTGRDIMTYLFDPDRAMKSLAEVEPTWGGDIATRMAAKAEAWKLAKATPGPLPTSTPTPADPGANAATAVD